MFWNGCTWSSWINLVHVRGYGSGSYSKTGSKTFIIEGWRKCDFTNEFIKSKTTTNSCKNLSFFPICLFDPNILDLNNAQITETLLYGKENFHKMSNTSKVDATIKYLIETARLMLSCFDALRMSWL